MMMPEELKHPFFFKCQDTIELLFPEEFQYYLNKENKEGEWPWSDFDKECLRLKGEWEELAQQLK